MIQFMIQIECLHGSKFLDSDQELDCDADHFALCKRDMCLTSFLLYANRQTQWDPPSWGDTEQEEEELDTPTHDEQQKV